MSSDYEGHTSLNSSSIYFTAEESPATSPSPNSSLKAMVVSELECPICLSMMVGRYHQPFFCSNGHPCCTYCTTRVSGCPSCRSSGPWGRCLTVERMGSWMLQRGIVENPSPPPPLPNTPVRDWQTVQAGTVPRNNIGRVQLFRSEGRIVGHSNDGENISNFFEDRSFGGLPTESEASSSTSDMSPILYHNPSPFINQSPRRRLASIRRRLASIRRRLTQSLRRRLASIRRRLTASPPSLSPTSRSGSPSSIPLSAMGSLWLGSSSPSSLTPTSRDSPEERVER